MRNPSTHPYQYRLHKFRKEFGKYNRDVVKTNRYNLSKIVGKMNLFEDVDGANKDEIEFVRTIPNSDYVVLKKNNTYALGDKEHKPVTDFDYLFIEGSMGDHDKIIRCVTVDGNIEDFSEETEEIVEDTGIGVSALGSTAVGDGVGGVDGIDSGDIVGDIDSIEVDDDTHPIDHSKIMNGLFIPYLSHYKILDVGRRNNLSYKRTNKHKTRRKNRR